MVLVATLLDCDMILWIVEDKLPSEVTIVFQEKFRLVTISRSYIVKASNLNYLKIDYRREKDSVTIERDYKPNNVGKCVIGV